MNIVVYDDEMNVVSVGFSAVGDKIEEKSHEAKAKAHKEAL